MDAESAYLFRHAVLRDVAYQLLLPSMRAKLHSLAFEVLEEGLDPDIAGPLALELADHADAAALARRTMSPEMGRRAVVTLGSVAFDRSDMNAALRHYQRAEHLAREAGHEKYLFQALGNVGIAYARLGRNAAAQASMADAIWFAKTDKDRLTLKLNMVALVANAQGAEAGIGAMGDLPERVREIGDPALLAHTLNSLLGMQLALQGHNVDATYAECMEAATRCGLRQIAAICTVQFSSVLASRGDYAQAQTISLRAAQDLREIGDLRTLSGALAAAVSCAVRLAPATMDDARRLPEAARITARLDDPHALSAVVHARVLFALARGRLGIAGRLLRRQHAMVARFNLSAESGPSRTARRIEHLLQQVRSREPLRHGLPPAAFADAASMG